MATIRVNRQAAQSGQLPQICICCGMPATQFVPHTFRCNPTWLIILVTVSTLIPLFWWMILICIVISLSHEALNLNLPVCSSHTTRFKWPVFLGLATAGLLLLLPISILALILVGNQDSIVIVVPIFVIIVLAYVIARTALLFSGPRVTEYSAGVLELAGVADSFAQHVSGRGSVGLTQQYPAPQAYTGNYGVDQAAYQHAYRAPAGSSTRTLLIAAVAVGVPLVLVGMIAVAALGVRSMMGHPVAGGRADLSRQTSSDFAVGDTVYIDAGGWYRATVVEVHPHFVRIKYTGYFGSEEDTTYPPNWVHRQLPSGAELVKPRPLAPAFSPSSANPTRPSAPMSKSSSAEKIAGSSAPSTETKATSGSLLPETTAARPETPANDSGPLSKDDAEFKPGDAAYFQQFGKWYRATIVRKLGGPVYELTYYDQDFKRELKSVRQTIQLQRTPPDGAQVIDGPESAAASDSPARSNSTSAEFPSKDNPPGFAAPASSQKKGAKVYAWWGSKWWDGEIVSSRKGEILVHYDGWSSNSDEWLSVDRVRLKEEPKGNRSK